VSKVCKSGRRLEQNPKRTFRVKTMAGGYTFLVWGDTGDEVVLDIVGFIAACELPPVTCKKRFNSANNRTLVYSLSLAGPGDPLFKKALSAHRRIYKIFEESLAEGVLHPYVAHTVGDLDRVLAETRFITPTKHNPFMEGSIPDSYDPDGILADLVAGGKFTFTEDNTLSFSQIVQDSEEKLMKLEARPNTFRRGHLVEASLCFRTVVIGSKEVFLTRIDSVMLVSRVGAQLINDQLEQDRCSRVLLSASEVIIRKRRHVSDELEEGTQVKRVHEG